MATDSRVINEYGITPGVGDYGEDGGFNPVAIAACASLDGITSDHKKRVLDVFLIAHKLEGNRTFDDLLNSPVAHTHTSFVALLEAEYNSRSN